MPYYDRFVTIHSQFKNEVFINQLNRTGKKKLCIKYRLGMEQEQQQQQQTYKSINCIRQTFI